MVLVTLEHPQYHDYEHPSFELLIIFVVVVQELTFLFQSHYLLHRIPLVQCFLGHHLYHYRDLWNDDGCDFSIRQIQKSYCLLLLSQVYHSKHFVLLIIKLLLNHSFRRNCSRLWTHQKFNFLLYVNC